MKLLSIAGARPNFMKLASIAQAVQNHNKSGYDSSDQSKIEHIIVHTGQHYDTQMSQNFFNDLGIPKPDVILSGKGKVSKIPELWDGHAEERIVEHLLNEIE